MITATRLGNHPILVRIAAATLILAIVVYAVAVDPRRAGAEAVDLQVGAIAYVNTDALVLRSATGIDAAQIAVLEPGEAVTIITAGLTADGYDWYGVDTAEGTGYVAGEFLATTVAYFADAIALGDTLLVNTDSLNLRAAAGSAADILATLVAGAEVTVMDLPVDVDGREWVMVETTLGEGWLATDYLARVVTENVEFAIGAYVVTTDTVRLRGTASTELDPLANLAAGELMMVVDAPVVADGQLWFPVVSVAGDGWVAAEYLSAEAA